MDMHQSIRLSAALVEIVDVLCDKQAIGRVIEDLVDEDVGLAARRLEYLLSPLIVPTPDETGIVLERALARERARIHVLPIPVPAAVRAEPTFGRDAGSGDHEYATRHRLSQLAPARPAFRIPLEVRGREECRAAQPPVPCAIFRQPSAKGPVVAIDIQS